MGVRVNPGFGVLTAHTVVPSALTLFTLVPDGHPEAIRACTCDVSICAAPTAPLAIKAEVTPPAAMATVPLAVIGPPVSPAPVATLVTVPALGLPQVHPELQVRTCPPVQVSPPTVTVSPARDAYRAPGAGV